MRGAVVLVDSRRDCFEGELGGLVGPWHVSFVRCRRSRPRSRWSSARVRRGRIARWTRRCGRSARWSSASRTTARRSSLRTRPRSPARELAAACSTRTAARSTLFDLPVRQGPVFKAFGLSGSGSGRFPVYGKRSEQVTLPTACIVQIESRRGGQACIADNCILRAAL
jgi:hypothetical protein